MKSNEILCTVCHGKGLIPNPHPDLITKWVYCKTCNGTGWVDKPEKLKIPDYGINRKYE